MKPKLIHWISGGTEQFYLFDIGKKELPFALYENKAKFSDGIYRLRFQYKEFTLTIKSEGPNCDVFGVVESFFSDEREFMNEYWRHP